MLALKEPIRASTVARVESQPRQVLEKLLLLPAQVLFLELVIDPLCSVAFEAEPPEADSMARPPRDSRQPMFGAGLVALSALQGIVALVGVWIVYLWASAQQASTEATRSAVFAAMVLVSLALVVNCRSRQAGLENALGRRNPSLAIVALATLIGLALVFGVPVMREWFRFASLTPAALGVAAAASMAAMFVNEMVKRVWR